VGRSDQPAYAYLFYPDRRVISELAMKRLRIISDFTELGSGFRIALKTWRSAGPGTCWGGSSTATSWPWAWTCT